MQSQALFQLIIRVKKAKIPHEYRKSGSTVKFIASYHDRIQETAEKPVARKVAFSDTFVYIVSSAGSSTFSLTLAHKRKRETKTFEPWIVDFSDACDSSEPLKEHKIKLKRKDPSIHAKLSFCVQKVTTGNVFKMFDKENKGYLSYEEFADLFDYIFPNTLNIVSMDKKDILALFDENKDGKVQQSEWVAMVEILLSAKANPQKLALRVFNWILNGKEQGDIEDVRKFLEIMGVFNPADLCEKELSLVMNQFSNKGLIGFDELWTAVGGTMEQFHGFSTSDIQVSALTSVIESVITAWL